MAAPKDVVHGFAGVLRFETVGQAAMPARES
jgi:hypothetical protein